MRVIGWGLVGLLGAAAFAVLALSRGESVNAAWIVVAGVCSYSIGYRFYSRFIALKVFALDDHRATPAERLNNGRDFVPTSKWVLYGHHFAAIAGAGPLVGPILAAQFGYLPGTLWLIFGVVLGGAVQDFTILCCSLRRDGKSLGQMATEEVNKVAGISASVAILAIMVILLAVLGLIVVNALKASPWGLFTIVCTIPIAMVMGLWMRGRRPGRITEATVAGVTLLLVALVAGGWVNHHPVFGPMFTWTGTALAWALIVYGFSASVLPVWLLLSPRDYLSTFLKVGTVIILAVAILILLPPLRLPAVTRFVDGSGPVFAGKLFPFAFITIACGAISGFHALVASGTTPKMLTRESHARLIGYGGMLTESFVGLMAMIAAATMDPGVYFAMNAPPAVLGTTPASAAEVVSQWGFTVTPQVLEGWARQVGESSLLSRVGGAPSLAVGMANILHGVFSGAGLALWYHFALMFEALFILTTIDAGTRVGRFMLQDLVGNIWKPMGDVSWAPGIWAASTAIVAGWGYFLYQGVIDPLGGINSLWPLFGIANQLLAAVALCVVTTIIIKMGKARYAWATTGPLAFLVVVTLTAGWQKVFAADPKLGFFAQARALRDAGAPQAAQRIFNNNVDAGLTLFFMAVVVIVILASAREWWLVISKRKAPRVNETPFVETALAAGD
ncbi:MAG TPA: carbon starvation CstA family protein [Gemmatimonadales bacterium]|jgi:carbon starvation protein